MSITIDQQDARIFDGSHPFKFLRDAEYDWAPPLCGFSGDSIVLGQFTSDGKLKVDATFSGSISIGDVSVLLEVGAGTHKWDGVLNPDLLTYSGLVQDPRMSFTGGALNVNISGAVASSGVNVFGHQAVVQGLWVTVANKVILAGESFNATGFIAWGDADAEWSLEKTSGQMGGIRTSPSRLSEEVRYEEPITVVGPDTVSLKVKHWYAGKTVDFYANLEGEIS